MKALLRVLVLVCLLASLLETTAQQRDVINDPLYRYQWHLENTGQQVRTVDPRVVSSIPAGILGEDINVRSVWHRYKGEGIYIAIVDGDLDFTHSDLKDNISVALSHDFYRNVTNVRAHATNVAGIVAARDNNIRIRGVAPRATIFSLNLTGGPSRRALDLRDIMDSMTRHTTRTAVSNNSWGSQSFFETLGGNVWKMAVETGIKTGFDGKGTVYVFAGGNIHRSRLPFLDANNTTRTGLVHHIKNSNYSGNANYHAVVAVCAVNNRGIHNGSSEFGANLWVCAPGSHILTTDRNRTIHSNDAFSWFSGTSAAAPMVSGVVALMRQANPTLTWRDVKLILANSARQNDAADSDWDLGAKKYGSFSEQYHFNHKYGFGVVDAQAAVDLAEDWINLPTREAIEEVHTTRSITIGNITTSTVSVQSAIDFIEYLEIPIDFGHIKLHDLSIKLSSAAGTTSSLVVPSSENLLAGGGWSGKWHFGSARHLGENPNGTWALEFADTRSIRNRGVLRGWSLNIHGYKIKMKAIAGGTSLATNFNER